MSTVASTVMIESAKQAAFDEKAALPGPGPITMATYLLVCKLVEKGTIEKRDAVHILDMVSTKRDPLFESNTNKTLLIVGDNHSTSTIRVDAALCSGVLDRLEMFSNRIRSSGKAILPPSKAVMGPPFAPALDFLREVIREAIATETVNVVPPIETRKRMRADGD